MRVLLWLGLMFYVAYLVHVGLLLLLVPWSSHWPSLLVQLPASAGGLLNEPAVRGAISAFGALHLMFVGLEVTTAGRARRPGPGHATQ